MLMFCMAAAVFIPRRLIMVNNTISPIAIALVTGSENANSSWNGVTAARARDAMEQEAGEAVYKAGQGMIGLGKIGGHAAGDRHFRAELGKAKAAEYANYAADYPAHKRHTHGHVYTLKHVAAKIIDTGTYGHAGHKADA